METLKDKIETRARKLEEKNNLIKKILSSKRTWLENTKMRLSLLLQGPRDKCLGLEKLVEWKMETRNKHPGVN